MSSASIDQTGKESIHQFEGRCCFAWHLAVLVCLPVDVRMHVLSWQTVW